MKRKFNLLFSVLFVLYSNISFAETLLNGDVYRYNLLNENTYTACSGFMPSTPIHWLWDGSTAEGVHDDKASGNVAAWVEFDFGKEEEITEAKLFQDGGRNRVTHWKVARFVDDAWVDIFSYTPSVTEGWQTKTFDVKASKIRFYAMCMNYGGTYNNLTGLKADCADPYVLKHDGVYYLYGTGGNDGIKVYQSNNAASWSNAVGATNGYALHKNDVWGEQWFWAPEVYFINDKFYMFYSAEEHISVAESTSPLGPFTQTEAQKKPFHPNIKEIDTHLFIDDDGKKYLYFVRFTDGNEIWVAELNDDLYSIKESTLIKCFGSNSTGWENSQLEPRARVVEGPFVLKHNELYYLTYSANHYQNPDYGVGYAVSRNPMGPWTKYSGNPILIRNDKIQGVGHHSFITLSEGCQYIVYHSHNNMTAVQPRKAGMDPYEFIPAASGPDILKIHGPTTTSQTLCSGHVSIHEIGLYAKESANNISILNMNTVKVTILSNVLLIDNAMRLKFSLFDIYGRLIKTTIIQNSHERIEIADLPNGIYFYSVGTLRGKILK